LDRIVIPGVTRNYFNIPVWLAQRTGIFSRLDLEVVTHRTDKGTDESSAMIRDGRAQLGSCTTEIVVTDREAGGHLTILGGRINRLPFSLIAQPEIKSFADLCGKVIGVSSLNSGTSTMIVRWCAAEGLRYPEDFSLLAMGPIEERWRMLQSGEIAAGLQGVPLDFVAEDAGYTNLGSPTKVFPNFQFSVIIADERWAAANRDIVVRYLLGVLEGTQLLYADKKIAGAVAMAETDLSQNYVDRAWEAYVANEIIPRDGEVNEAGLRTLIELSASVRDVASRAETKIEDCVDRSYLEEAQKRFAAA
jgi:NitT/TauT family transport system substrate-binding protein